ncbi:MAG TPA: hypothetical protein VJY15_07115 [Candidatus Acidoferrum sp.]|nr:hypothetical protein [Candidatus Acidoferrum sp.]
MYANSQGAVFENQYKLRGGRNPMHNRTGFDKSDMKTVALCLILCAAAIGCSSPHCQIKPPIIVPSIVPTGNELLLESGSVIYDPSTKQYYWYYHVFENGKYHISFASSSNIAGPWVAHDTPIVEASGDGWERDSVANAMLIAYNGKFYMYYSGDQGPYWSVGYATADSAGGPWVKQGEILPNFGYVNSVVYHNGFHLYSEFPISRQTTDPGAWDYGPVSLAVASSPDGPWTQKGIVLPIGQGWESGGTSGGSVFFLNGKYHMFYGATSDHFDSVHRLLAHESIGYAYSDDGVHFTRSIYNPIVDSRSVSLANVNAFHQQDTYLFYIYRKPLPSPVDGWILASEDLGELTLNCLAEN